MRLGIGVIAVARGRGLYPGRRGQLAGIIRKRVDWGVVWLYAGAIIFGRTLDSTGAAYWLARSALDIIAPLGIDHGVPLMLTSNGLTAVITQFMADGRRRAAGGPHRAETWAPWPIRARRSCPFTAMATAASSSFAYCLIIGTPPNAIVYSSGYLGPKDFFRVGMPMWIIANVVLGLMVWAVLVGARFRQPARFLIPASRAPSARTGRLPEGRENGNDRQPPSSSAWMNPTRPWTRPDTSAHLSHRTTYRCSSSTCSANSPKHSGTAHPADRVAGKPGTERGMDPPSSGQHRGPARTDPPALPGRRPSPGPDLHPRGTA